MQTGQRPDVSHLRVFGCTFWVYVDETKRNKLEGKALLGIHLRSEGHENHRLYFLGSSRVTTSPHVRFEEGRFPFKGPGRGIEVLQMGEAVTSCIKECSESAEKGADISTATKMIQMNNTADDREEGENRKNQHDKGPTHSYNPRLVVMGDFQIEGKHFHQTFAPVVDFITVRNALCLAAANYWEVHQMDAVTAFLNGKVNEEIYVKLPDGTVARLEKFIWSKASTQDMGRSLCGESRGKGIL